MVKSGDRLRLVEDISGVLESLIVKVNEVLNSTLDDRDKFDKLKNVVLPECKSSFQNVLVNHADLAHEDLEFCKSVGSAVLNNFSTLDAIKPIPGAKNQSFNLARSIVSMICVSFIRAIASRDPRGDFLDVTESLIASVDSLSTHMKVA